VLKKLCDAHMKHGNCWVDCNLYFSLQFSEWLRLEKRLFFNELTSEETRAHFKDFVAAWNARCLPARFYMGLADASLRRTKHAWAIKGDRLLHVMLAYEIPLSPCFVAGPA
jgi:hypothetical protein